MADIFTKEKRSSLMAKVRATETKPEITVRRFLYANGFRYRKNLRTLPGTPDIVLVKYKTVVFINGCFWHGHKNCKLSRLPKSNIRYWTDKIAENIKRDKSKDKKLRKLGWKVLRVWGCKLKPAQLDKLILKIRL